jgi:hypothetical protein
VEELSQVRAILAAKYGKEFVAAAAELRPDCGVSRNLIEKLSAIAPSGKAKIGVLKEIAKEHNVDWDSTSLENALTKAPEDLLDGSRQFQSSNDVPVLRQHNEDLPSLPMETISKGSSTNIQSPSSTNRPSTVAQASEVKPYIHQARIPPPTTVAPSQQQSKTLASQAIQSQNQKPAGDGSHQHSHSGPGSMGTNYSGGPNQPVKASRNQEFHERTQIPQDPRSGKENTTQASTVMPQLGESSLPRAEGMDFKDVKEAAVAASASADRAVAAAQAAAQLATNKYHSLKSTAANENFSKVVQRLSEKPVGDDDVVDDDDMVNNEPNSSDEDVNRISNRKGGEQMDGKPHINQFWDHKSYVHPMYDEEEEEEALPRKPVSHGSFDGKTWLTNDREEYPRRESHSLSGSKSSNAKHAPHGSGGAKTRLKIDMPLHSEVYDAEDYDEEKDAHGRRLEADFYKESTRITELRGGDLHQSDGYEGDKNSSMSHLQGSNYEVAESSPWRKTTGKANFEEEELGNSPRSYKNSDTEECHVHQSEDIFSEQTTASRGPAKTTLTWKSESHTFYDSSGSDDGDTHEAPQWLAPGKMIPKPLGQSVYETQESDDRDHSFKDRDIAYMVETKEGTPGMCVSGTRNTIAEHLSDNYKRGSLHWSHRVDEYPLSPQEEGSYHTRINSPPLEDHEKNKPLKAFAAPTDLNEPNNRSYRGEITSEKSPSGSQTGKLKWQSRDSKQGSESHVRDIVAKPVLPGGRDPTQLDDYSSSDDDFYIPKSKMTTRALPQTKPGHINDAHNLKKLDRHLDENDSQSIKLLDSQRSTRQVQLPLKVDESKVTDHSWKVPSLDVKLPVEQQQKSLSPSTSGFDSSPFWRNTSSGSPISGKPSKFMSRSGSNNPSASIEASEMPVKVDNQSDSTVDNTRLSPGALYKGSTSKKSFKMDVVKTNLVDSKANSESWDQQKVPVKDFRKTQSIPTEQVPKPQKFKMIRPPDIDDIEAMLGRKL